jgi:hypothetical protein
LATHSSRKIWRSIPWKPLRDQSCLGARPCVNPPIGEATALSGLENERGALGIGDFVRRAMVIAELKLGEIAV